MDTVGTTTTTTKIDIYKGRLAKECEAKHKAIEHMEWMREEKIDYGRRLLKQGHEINSLEKELADIKNAYDVDILNKDKEIDDLKEANKLLEDKSKVLSADNRGLKVLVQSAEEKAKGIGEANRILQQNLEKQDQIIKKISNNHKLPKPPPIDEQRKDALGYSFEPNLDNDEIYEQVALLYREPFKKFLRENEEAEEGFWINFNCRSDDEQGAPTKNFFYEIKAEEYMSRGFQWPASEPGRTFWADLDVKWEAIVGEIKDSKGIR